MQIATPQLEDDITLRDAEGITVRQGVAFMLKVVETYRSKGHNAPGDQLRAEAYGMCKAFDMGFIDENGDPGETKL